MRVHVLLLVCFPLVYSKHVSEHDLNDLERLLNALADVNRNSLEKGVGSQLTEDERNDPAAIVDVADKAAEDQNSQADVTLLKNAQEERNVQAEDEERNEELSENERNSQNTEGRADTDFRIVGGNEIDDISQWPWLVSIQYTIGGFLGIGSYEGSCTASLIADRWILTTAHCVDGKKSDPDIWTVRMGDVDFSNNIFEAIASLFGGGPAVEEDVVKIIIHPEYVGTEEAKWLNDIALMKLESAAPLDDEDIGLVTLPPQGDYYFPQDGAMCIMKGWGCTSAGSGHAPTARIVEIPKVSDSGCSIKWNLDEMQTRLCAGYFNQGMGGCPGDSGGPLVSLNSAGHYVQVGIASFASKDAPGSSPGGFTRVTHYVDWIQQTIANN